MWAFDCWNWLFRLHKSKESINMTLVTESWVVDSLLSLTLVLFLLYCYLSHVYGYFRSRGIPYLTPVPLVGHIFLLTESQNSIARKLYNSFPAERFYGFFQSVVSIIKLFFNTHYMMVRWNLTNFFFFFLYPSSS